jgi:hypothetical protein
MDLEWGSGRDHGYLVWAGGEEDPTLLFISMSEAEKGCRGEGDSYTERIG